MEKYTQITLDEWTQWKEDIRKKLSETAGNFVYIGYRLKQIRDSGMFDGCADIFEFAQREWGLGKSTVSRFIAINEKYSEGGNSLELKEEFKQFSSSKLSEMLTLPDSEIQLITEKTTVKEIRALKEFDHQDPSREIVDGEETAWTPLEKCLIDFFKDRKEVLNEIMRYMEDEQPEYKKAMELMNPSGQSSHKKGIVFLFLYDWNTGVKYKLMTQPEPVSLTWQELLNNIFRIYGTCDLTDAWSDFYRSETEAEKDAQIQSDQGSDESVATSQQDKRTEEKSEVKKAASEVSEDCEDGQSDRMKRPDKVEIHQPAAVVQEEPAEEQLPGQMSVEDYPEILPTSYEEIKEENTMENTENADGGAEDTEGSGDGDLANQGYVSGDEGEDQSDAENSSDTADDADVVPSGLGASGDVGTSGKVPDEPLSEMYDEQQDYYQLWMDVREARMYLIECIDYLLRLAPGEENPDSPGSASLEEVQEGYDKAIDLAAAMEKVLIARQREGAKKNG